MSEHRQYENPLVDRYASPEMSYVWSPQKKFSTWRRLWLALARAQRDLGLAISEEQLAELAAHLDDIDYERAAALERELRHDVMSHIHALGERCPQARPIIHLGATSCDITDNTELIQIRESLELVRAKLLELLAVLRAQALRYQDLPTLGFTHYQPAQLTTVGKRLCLWLQDFMLDFSRVQRTVDDLPFRGIKGTTGTQASFLTLFGGDAAKVRELDRRVTAAMGFRRALPITGQTYSRKVDYDVLVVLSGIAQSAYKMAGDLRLLANLKEIEEPFGKTQVGSSAMAYKRNPMRCERICGLARYIMSLAENAAHTHAQQWLERTLDDSANRRLTLPQAFLATDVVLSLATSVSDGLQVWPQVIRQRLEAELPFMATEEILMNCVQAGGDRQDLHEAIRQHSQAAAREVKELGRPNDLLARLPADPRFRAVHGRLDQLLEPRLFIGRASQQVAEFIAEEVDPVLAAHRRRPRGAGADVTV